jgi:hypothetical protein
MVRERTDLSSEESNSSNPSYQAFARDRSSSNATTVDMESYEVSKYEADCYYTGLIQGAHRPKLIYRTLMDKFNKPSGSEVYTRLMIFAPVFNSKLP